MQNGILNEQFISHPSYLQESRILSFYTSSENKSILIDFSVSDAPNIIEIGQSSCKFPLLGRKKGSFPVDLFGQHDGSSKIMRKWLDQIGT